MKRFISLITAGALALGTTTAFAQESGAPTGTETVTVTVEPVNSLGDTYSDGVLNYTELADGTYEVSGLADKAVTDPVIPSRVNGKKVTGIGEKAFWKCSGLTSVTISDGITSIGKFAFYKCFGLTSVEIPDSVTNICDEAFYDCDGLTLLVIPDSVISVGAGVFCDCRRLSSVTLPNGITSIKANTFQNCAELKTLAIPDSVTSIDDYAFAGCTGLETLPIPSNVTSIGKYAFNLCNSLETLTIPGSVKSIGFGAFYSCSALKAFAIPDGIKSIDGFTFFGCGELQSITIPKSVTAIGPQAFLHCDKLANVYYGGTKADWRKVKVDYANEYLLNAAIHCEDAAPVEVLIKAPENVDISDQSATATVNGETKPLTITDGKLDLSGLADGTYTFTFKANNCVPRTYKVTVSGGAATELENGVELHLIGDINGDGKINTTDILKAKLQTKGSNKLDGYDLAVADANKDGKVNGTDVLKLKLHAKGSTKLW